jgi:hypothetical protein
MDSNLKASLINLHGTLSSTGPVDEELQGLLHQLDGDIKLLLERRQQQGAPALESEVNPDSGTIAVVGSHSYGLAERTQQISAKFAAKHPKLEPALRELGNILSSMGI